MKMSFLIKQFLSCLPMICNYIHPFISHRPMSTCNMLWIYWSCGQHRGSYLWHTGSAALELVLLARLTSLARWRWSGWTSNPVAVVLDWVCRSKSVVVKSCRRSSSAYYAAWSACPPAVYRVFCTAPALDISLYLRCLHPRALPTGLHCCRWTKSTALNLSQVTIPTH